MRVLLGNPSPQDQGRTLPGPTITIAEFRDNKNEDGSYVSSYKVGTDAAEIRDYLFFNSGMVTHLPENTALLNIVASWKRESNTQPSWVVVEPGERDPEEAADLERFLSDFWKIPRGYPEDIEDTHYTAHGNNTIYAPGEKPEGE